MDPGTRDEEAGLTGARQPVRQRSSISSFLFITFLLFMLTSHNGDEFLARHQYQDALKSLTYQLSNYTSWMNGTSTSFTVPDQSPFIPSLLDIFKIQGDQLDADKASYYPNITGFVHGSARLHNITLPALAENLTAPWNSVASNYMVGSNNTEIAERVASWNWTASEKLAISVVEKHPAHMNGSIISDTIGLIHGRIELTDANTSEDIRLEFEGVHFLCAGLIYGFAEPTGRHIDIRLLPSLVPVALKNETAQLIEPELNTRINKLKHLIDAGVTDQDASEDAPPKSTCPFTFYAQIHPSQVPQYLMQELEEEIQKPTGIWTVDPPKLLINALLMSKECGIMYEIVESEGLRSRTFFRKVTSYASSAGLIYLALLVLYCRQSERSRTPSGLARVSRWSFLTQATVDSVSFAGHITFAILAEGRPSLTLIAPAFLSCILFVYEAQFSVLIHQIQAPENVVVTPPPLAIPSPPPTPAPQEPVVDLENSYPPAPAPAPTNQTTTSETQTQAQPPASTAAAQRDPPSFFAFFIHHIRTDPQARLWVTLFVFLTFIVRVILSPTLSMVFVGITYSFIWLPQIIRSMRRGRSSGLSKEYVVGTSLCRLYLALYFLACPKNVLDVEPRGWSYLLAAFVCMQACLVMLQDVFGPAIFLPERYKAVETYDYHPPLPLSSSEQSLGDCAICMEAIVVENRSRGFSEKKEKQGGVEWDLEGASEINTRRKGLGSGRFLGAMQTIARKNYSLAPCQHLFHTECLEKWLAIKNICPHCRRPLPPL